MRKIADGIMTVSWLLMDATWMTGHLNAASFFSAVGLLAGFVTMTAAFKTDDVEDQLSTITGVAWLTMNTSWMLTDIMGEWMLLNYMKYTSMTVGFIGLASIMLLNSKALAGIRRPNRKK
jgi:hypothetical protein